MSEKFITFTTIIHPAKKKLNISSDEYILLDIISKLEKNEKHSGWCYAGREYLASAVDIQRPSVSRMLSRLEKRGLVEIDDKSRFLKTTLKFSNAVNYYQTQRNPKAHDVTESYKPCNPKLQEAVTEGYADSNSNNNTDKKEKTAPEKLPYPLVKFNYNKKELTGLEESEVAAFCEKYPDIDVMATLKTISDWCLINKAKVSKRKNGLYPTIINWLRRDQAAYEDKVGYQRSRREANGKPTGKIYIDRRAYEDAVKRGEKGISFNPNAAIEFESEWDNK